MLAVADNLVFRKAVEHLRQYLLALDERFLAKIMPVEVQKVEDEVGQRMGRALFKGGLQVGKAALPGFREHHDLSIQDGAFHRKLA